jgi:hypothetical protein
MSLATKLRLPAVACALSLLICLPLVSPWVEMGTNDDPSYIRTAQLLAQTGHIVYNGWAAVMLGWQLYLGAFFIKLFGSPFLSTRLSTLLVGMAVAFLVQRSCVRAGLTEWNATLATLTLVLSPLFLPLTFSFMTDIGGMLGIVLCFYACLRAIQAESDTKASGWVVFAAIVSGIGGTSRQFTWLGVLVMAPCTVWLLRARRRVVFYGLAGIVVGLSIMFGSLAWFNHQPYAAIDSILRAPIDRAHLQPLVRSFAAELLDLPVFLLPALLAFVPRVSWHHRRTRWWIVASGAFAVALLALILTRPDSAFWLEPCGHNYVTAHGVMDGTVIRGQRPIILHPDIRIVLTVLVLVGLMAVGAVVLGDERLASSSKWSSASRRPVLVLLLPFSLAYLALLVPRALTGDVFDRYLLPLVFVALIVLTLYYQTTFASDLPVYAAFILAVVAAYSVAGTHDAFTMLRARLDLVQEIRRSGVPAEDIDGGWEYNSWTQIVNFGHVNVSLVHIPADAYDPHPQLPRLNCPPQMWNHAPGLRPQYALSFDPAACSGASGFSPVTYSEWLGPRHVTVYAVKVGPGEPQELQAD